MSDLMQTSWIVWDINKQIITVKMSYMSCFVDIMKEYFDTFFYWRSKTRVGKVYLLQCLIWITACRIIKCW